MRTSAYYFILASICCLHLFHACSPKPKNQGGLDQLIKLQGNEFDLFIQNGKVFNGKDTTYQNTDLLIKDGRIQFIGKVDTAKIKAKQEIDASGACVSPGFIDTHAHGNPYKTPGFPNFLAMGVTSICLGQDGRSPTNDDLAVWMRNVQDTTPGVNIVPFVGHATLREQAKIGYDSLPTTAQLERMNQLLQTAFDQGCFGLSTGLEYLPGALAKEKELIGLAKVVGQNNALLMSHIRSEDDDQLQQAIEELLKQGAHCNVHVSHIKSVYGKGAERAQQILDLLQQHHLKPNAVTADLYPYNASFTGIGIVFPSWAKQPNDYKTVKKIRRQELLDYLYKRVNHRNGPGATLLGTPPYKGLSLAQASTKAKKPFEELLLEDIGPDGASAAYFVMDSVLQQNLLNSELVMICSDGSPTMHHPRGYGSFAKVIETYVVDLHLLSLGQAIRKMTSLPAQTLGITDRGTIEEGNWADILVFDPQKVHATANYLQPNSLAEGFDYVIVNGHIAYQGERTSSKRHGQVLQRNRTNSGN